MARPNPPLTPDRALEVDRDLLTPMIAAYAADGPTRERLRATIESAPALKESLLFAIDKGSLTALTRDDPGGGAAAAYDLRSSSIKFPPELMDDPNRAVFVLGHETGHAVDNAVNGDYDKRVFLEGAKQLMRDGKPGPRDFTDLVRGAIADNQRDEAEAHISGFNALVSKLTADHTRGNVGAEPSAQRAIPPTSADLYAAYPDSMRDFMVVRGQGLDRTATLKPGLALGADGTLSLDAGTSQGRGNIDAMQVYFADKLPSTLGPNGALNYPHKALGESLDLVHRIEQSAIGGNIRPAYRVDFDQIGFTVNPALMKPPAGLIPSGVDFDTAYPGLHRSYRMGNTVTGSQGLLSRQLLEHATTALERVDERHLGVTKGSAAFGDLCAYTACVAGSHKMTQIGCVVPSDKGGLIVCNKDDARDPTARLAGFDPARAADAPAPEHMRRLADVVAPLVLETYLDQNRPKPEPPKKSDTCVMM